MPCPLPYFASSAFSAPENSRACLFLAFTRASLNHSGMTPTDTRNRSQLPTGEPPYAISDSTQFSPPTAAFLAIAVLVIHIATNLITSYGFHRDEFLYFAMGEHLSLWRMDFPPFIAIVARFSHTLFNESLAGLRLAPAFAHAALVYCATFAASVFGGRRSAQMLAGLAVATSPLFMRAGAMFQPVTFDQLWWTLALLALTLRIRENDPKHWLGLGIFLGLGALTKFSVAFIAAGVVVAVLATPLRRDLLTKFPYVGLLAAIVIGHPSITGQLALGWPVRGQMADLQSSQLARVQWLDFITGQFGFGPIVLLGVAGFVFAFRSRWRPIAIATGAAFVILLVMHGKAYYIGPIYPILAAAGAAALDQLGQRIAPKRPTKVLAVAAAAVALYGIATLPFGLPLLAPVEMAEFSKALGGASATRTNTGEQLPLPQDYADMLGWDNLASRVATVWASLPPADTAAAVLIASNYGRAGALDLLGRPLGLPPVIAAAGSYWFFGPGTKRGDVAVAVDDNAETLRQFFREVTEVARTDNPWGVTEEQSVGIYICRGAIRSLQDVWPALSGRN